MAITPRSVLFCTVVVLFSAILGTCVHAQAAHHKLSTTIPQTAVEPGVLVSKPTSVHPTQMVKLEVFLDLNCPASHEAYVKTILPLANHFENENKVVIKAHMYPLPYHRNAMLCTQGMFAIQNLKPGRVLDYIGAVLAEWEFLGVMNTKNFTEYEVLKEITRLAVESTQVNPEKFEGEINEYREHCKKVWKYGAKRGVSGTPTFFFNGMEMDVSDNASLSDWTEHIQATLDVAVLFSATLATLVHASQVKLNTRTPQTAVEPGVLVSKPTTVHPTQVVKLEVFLDLNCPDSLEVYVKTILPLANHFENENKVVIKVHMYPLPYHRNAMLCTQGMFAIQNLKPDRVLDYIGAILAEWELLGVMNTKNYTEYEVLTEITRLAVQTTQVSPVKFEAEINEYRAHCKKVWKYGAKRGVSATPTYFFNGMEMDVSDNASLSDWIEYIQAILNSMNASLRVPE